MTDPHVFVLDRHGKPLQPCRPGRARQLLKVGRAVVVRHTPFVIRLTDRTAADSTVAGVEVGLDPGSQHTGIAVFTQRGGSRAGKYSVQLDHRGALIRDKLTARSAYRRGRRSRNLRYRAPRFLDRTKPKGWLAPSLRHRVDTTMSWVARLRRWAPVRTGVHTGRVAVRAIGSFNITTATGTRQGINHKHIRLLQRADGYAYTTSQETTIER